MATNIRNNEKCLEPDKASLHSIIFKKKYVVRDEIKKPWGCKRVLINILLFSHCNLTIDPANQ